MPMVSGQHMSGYMSSQMIKELLFATVCGALITVHEQGQEADAYFVCFPVHVCVHVVCTCTSLLGL